MAPFQPEILRRCAPQDDKQGQNRDPSLSLGMTAKARPRSLAFARNDIASCLLHDIRGRVLRGRSRRRIFSVFLDWFSQPFRMKEPSFSLRTCVFSGAVGIMSRNGRFFLLLMSCVIILLLFFSFWAVRSNKAAGSFEIHNVLMCDEVDDRMQPLGAGSVFSYGARQLCLWFDYSRSSGGDGVRVKWYYRGRPIHSEVLRLTPGDGAKAYCLLLEDGSPLPKGSYSVRISMYDRVFSDVPFVISE